MIAVVLAASVMCATPETLEQKFAGTLINEADLTEAVEARKIVWLGPLVLAGLSTVTLGSSFLMLVLGAAGRLSVAIPILVFGVALVLHVMTGISVIVALVDGGRLDRRIEELRKRTPDEQTGREVFGPVLARF